jgi:hypothetical protein
MRCGSERDYWVRKATNLSVLLVGGEGALAEEVVRRLVSAEDEVRVIEQDPEAASRWRSLGAHVALGSAADPDLVERAAEYARTVVVFDRGPEWRQEVLAAVLEGAGSARVVLCSESADERIAAALAESGFDHIVLRTRRRSRWPLRTVTVSAQDLAEAVDAADDLAGNPRLDLDLGSPEGWRALRLAPR